MLLLCRYQLVDWLLLFVRAGIVEGFRAEFVRANLVHGQAAVDACALRLLFLALFRRQVLARERLAVLTP